MEGAPLFTIQFKKCSFHKISQMYHVVRLVKRWYTITELKKSEVLNKFNPISAKFIKWSDTLKQIVGKLQTNGSSVFDHFVGLTLKGLRSIEHTAVK